MKNGQIAMDLQDIQNAVRARFMLTGSHATLEAAADGVTLTEVWAGILDSNAAVIENYPNDPRRASCLLYCEVLGRPEHAVIAYPSASAA